MARQFGPSTIKDLAESGELIRMEHFDLDDMLRNGLSGPTPNARFEFKEEYWEQAVALLEADERKKKRRRILAYSCVLTLLLIPAAVVYYKTAVVSSPPTPTPAPARTEAAFMAQSVPKAEEYHLNSVGEQPRNAASPRQNKNLNTQATNLRTPESLINKTTVQQSPLLAETKNNSLHNTQNATDNVPKLQKSQIENVAKNNDSQPSQYTVLTAPEQSADSYNTPKPGVTVHPSSPEINVATRATVVAPHVLPVVINAPDLSVKAPVLTTFQLPLRTAIPTPITKVHRNKPFEWGIVASISTPSGYYIDEKPGLALGSNVRFRLHKNIYLQGDLMWRRWKGNVNVQQYSQLVTNKGQGLDSIPGSTSIEFDIINDIVTSNSSTQYDFGYLNTEVVAVANEIHQIELPLTIQYQWRRFTLETGVQLSAKILKRVITEQYQSQSLAPAAQKVAATSYFERFGSNNNRFQTAVIGGIHWQPLKHWRFGCRVNWSTSNNASLRYEVDGFTPSANITNNYSVSPTRMMTTEARAVFLF
jgi:hypothetical protein